MGRINPERVMTDYYVYSTLSNDNTYGGVFIAGKANVANKNIVTPQGISPSISPKKRTSPSVPLCRP